MLSIELLPDEAADWDWFTKRLLDQKLQQTLLGGFLEWGYPLKWWVDSIIFHYIPLYSIENPIEMGDLVSQNRGSNRSWKPKGPKV